MNVAAATRPSTEIGVMQAAVPTLLLAYFSHCMVDCPVTRQVKMGFLHMVRTAAAGAEASDSGDLMDAEDAGSDEDEELDKGTTSRARASEGPSLDGHTRNSGALAPTEMPLNFTPAGTLNLQICVAFFV